jgi:hypothetical protein
MSVPIFCSFLPDFHATTDHNLLTSHSKIPTFNILNIVQTLDNIRHIYTYWIYLSVLCCHCIQWMYIGKIRSTVLFCLQTAHWIIMSLVLVTLLNSLWLISCAVCSFTITTILWPVLTFPIIQKLGAQYKNTHAVYDWNISDVCI